MASGSFNGTTSNKYITPTIIWSSERSEVVENASFVTVKLYYTKLSSSVENTFGYWSGGIYIDGVGQSFNDVKVELIPGGGSVLVATVSRTVSHNDDGTKSVLISANGSIAGTTLSSTTISKTVTLDTLPQASTITCDGVTEIESKPVIKITRKSDNFTHTILYKFGAVSGTVLTKTTGTTISGWTIPSSFYSQIPNSQTGEGTLTCITYNGSEQVGEPKTCALKVRTNEAKCKPTVSGSVVDTNDKTIGLTGSNKILVRYASTALCTLTATLNNSAGSIKAKTINNTAISGNTLTINNVGTNIFDFYAKDSREYHNTDKVVIPTDKFISYIPLTNDAAISRDEPTNNKAILQIKGNYFAGSFGAKSNALTVKYKQVGGNYVSVTPTIKDNKYSATITLSDLDYTKAFDFEVVVSDAINTITKPLTLQKGIPVFDWGENDFNFNVPVTMKGKSLSTLKPIYLTASTLDAASSDNSSLNIGYGVIDDVGYLSFYIGWIVLQFKVSNGNKVHQRVKYGNSSWGAWVEI